MVAYTGEDIPIYLLGVLSKGDRANFGPDEVAAMKDFMMAIKQVSRRRRRT